VQPASSVPYSAHPYSAQPYANYPYLAAPYASSPYPDYPASTYPASTYPASTYPASAPPYPGQPYPQGYPGPPYPAPPQPGQPYPQGYPGQPYPAPPQPGQPYPQGYPGQPYPAPPQPGQPYSAVASPYGQPVSGYPYGPYPVNPWAPAPRRSGGRTRWIVGILAVFLVCSVVGVGGLVGYADYAGALDTRAQWQPGAGPKVELPPAQNAPAAEWSSWARRSVGDALSAQAKALLDANEAGYLAAVDQDNATLLAEQTHRYNVLRAMGPGVWTQDLTGGLKDGSARSWQADIKISYCFGAATCTSAQLVESSTWGVKGDRLVMVGLVASDASWNGPRPWETDDLAVATGQRVVIAAAKTNAWRLPDAVKSADRAALVADTLGKWEPPPSRYVIFLAGPNDWKRWYGHSQPEWAAAWAVPVSDTVTEVVVRTEVVQQRGLETLLTHELTHVTTLAGKRDGAGRAAWWLIEGVADYATMIGKAVRSYDGITSTRAFVRSKWNGDPAVDAPSVNASLQEAGGRYGVAFLAVRRISDKYGQAKMLDFWGRVVHDNQDLNAAATAVLGASWASVQADCAAFVRSSTA
jgi:hypothetical protein